MTQDWQVISCFVKKFNEMHMIYPITEQGLLAIVETLKNYHIIYGNTAKTNHQSLEHYSAHHTSQHILHQHLLIDQEYTTKT